MKKIFTILVLTLSISSFAQTTVCYDTPDGIDNTWTGGWSYKEFIIPVGYKIDSVYGDFDRNGYPENELDFIFSVCLGTTVFGETEPVSPFNYQEINTSLYDHWIDLTSFNYSSIGVARVFLPTNTGAIWNSFCFAISPISNRAFNTRLSKIKAYPNPVSQTLYLTGKTDFSVYSLDGKKIFSGNSSSLDVSDYAPGIYIIKFINDSEQNILRFVKE